MFDKFEVLVNWKLSWDLSFLRLGVSDGHIFFDFSNYCPVAFGSPAVQTIFIVRLYVMHYSKIKVSEVPGSMLSAPC